MKVDLRYGKGFVSLQVPDNNVQQIIRPWQDESKADNVALLRQAVATREADIFQKENADKRLCVLVEDGTRDGPFEDIFVLVFHILRASSAVQFIISTGTHDAENPQNCKIRGRSRKQLREQG